MNKAFINDLTEYTKFKDIAPIIIKILKLLKTYYFLKYKYY
jgi:hypothetical protein